jgi:diacylglycerol kinase (ATP)
VAPSFLSSFRYAWMGVSYAFMTQRNFRIHAFMGTLALSLGVYLRLNVVEIAVIGLTIGAVLSMELINTALEIAKDCAAAAVLISAFGALMVAGLLILPKLMVVVSKSLGWV